MKILIGGSPCTYWSIAQTKNRETEASGLGLELFKNYVVARDKYRPDYFLYENNKSMSPAIREQITKELGVEPILIDSALVSAQSRQRLYWVGKRNPITGIYERVYIEQPEDRGVLLRDILESGVCWREKAYAVLTTAANGTAEDMIARRQRNGAAEPVNITAGGKAQCLRATYYKDGIRNMVGNTVDRKTCVAESIEYNPLHSCDVVITDQNIRCTYKDGSGTAQGYSVYFDDVKSPSVIAGHANKMKVIEKATGKEHPVYEVRDGAITIKGKQYPIKLKDGLYIIRKLTVAECKRLQTVPESYVFPVSNTQAYKMLGNGWTVDVIAHIISHFEGIMRETVEVLSMYDGMSCGQIALDKLGVEVSAYYATEIDEYAIKTTQSNFPDTIQLGDAFQVLANDWTPPISGVDKPKGDCYTMKSLILTAQEARELDKLGGLTVTKPIKPAPPYIEGANIVTAGGGEWYLESNTGNRMDAGDGVADMFAPPVQTEDAVFIREPWYRLKDPRGGESERVILAADSVVSEEQVSYKWSSPVSMPEAAARRFARVKSIGVAYGENVSPVWLIELEAVDKAAAVAADAGVPFSSASDPEEGSTYLTYAGDMSVEDHERMVAAINADRARLAEVQDRLIRIDLRRRELSSLMFEERDKVDPNDRDALEAENTDLDEEQGNLAREEADLRAALESAGAPAPTVEDHAREKLTNITVVLAGPSEGIPTLGDYDALKEEERELTAYLSAIDAGEAPEPTEGGLSTPDSAASPVATDENPPAAEDEEIGSFTIGKCKYCGREWGVTLEGAREGGFPTQRTADAAATRLCDCAEAVANREPIVGVAMAVTRGVCRYCGQIQEVGPHPSQAAADETASEVCNCPTARQERRVLEQVEDACERVQRLFGDEAESLGFKPVPDEAVGLLEKVVEMIARGPISSASLNVRGRCKAKFSITSKGKIKVSRSETRSCDLEDGE